MREIRPLLALAILISIATSGMAQRTTRPDPTDPAHPFDTPPPVTAPATAAQFDRWREQGRAALFLPKTMPAVAPRDYGPLTPMPRRCGSRVSPGAPFGLP